MYQYDSFDQKIVEERVKQFRGQTARYLAGTLSEEAFLPLRLQNGLYIQRQSPMLRVAVPYGMLSSRQLRKLAEITRTYDRSYCHVTTRQNIQFNWVSVEQVPEILKELATVDMHSIQTSGNCIRNTTCDPFAGVAQDELADPRPFCEIIRQWSTLHPEFAFLPRKFKIAVIGAQQDRASIQLHDIGLQLTTNKVGDYGFKVWVGGGLGRTPVLATPVREFLPQQELLAYLKAILRVYNRYGRRDNKYKARIKILVNTLGIDNFSTQVEEEFERTLSPEYLLNLEEVDYARSFFSSPEYEAIDEHKVQADLLLQGQLNPPFERWLSRNTHEHRVDGYSIVSLSLKSSTQAPGDISAIQLEQIAELAERYSFGEVRTTQQQNLVLTDVKQSDLFNLWLEATSLKLATPNIGTITDIVCCPGGDFCALANARSLPINAAIQQRFEDLDFLYDLGDMSLRISGCVNACAHHHIANIGILGVDKKGEEFYQITLGGQSGEASRLAKVLGPSLPMDLLPEAIERVIEIYLRERTDHTERFIDTFLRLGSRPFKEHVYGKSH
ncbi:nitrite/sulfite reductase [Motiliproteus sp. MSK22-1]|uniref:nitrite/sulfite reductase n=1 Tax=Motiliproteus sp. MSK22-1 TaxID=1897630 RepID=UPI000977576B|nr:nitrite/sulfite reductase [Motiliproteus sp. MSK22-1]OMH39514.1 sulfite reductase [Motiliproteus sp. MSK22-1]